MKLKIGFWEKLFSKNHVAEKKQSRYASLRCPANEIKKKTDDLLMLINSLDIPDKDAFVAVKKMSGRQDVKFTSVNKIANDIITNAQNDSHQFFSISPER